jgi:hydrogenase small subunit
MLVKTLFWIQTGACGGESLAILSAESPSLEGLLSAHDLDLLWHPSLSHAPMKRFDALVEAIASGAQPLDILCVEGSLITAPRGSGLFDSYKGRARIDIVRALAAQAKHVVAMGTCASFGGVHAAPPNPSDCIGLQFDRETPGGLLPPDWRSRAGLPVINIAGCPAHPHAMTQTLAALASDMDVTLDALNRPKTFFSTLVHQGCTRNEYHEYDVEDEHLGGKACLFFNLGCQGPMTQAVCNDDLWNGVSSKTRSGIPCFGCTEPDFPQGTPFFETPNIVGLPINLPDGVDRPHYLAYKGMAAAAAPERLKHRMPKD